MIFIELGKFVGLGEGAQNTVGVKVGLLYTTNVGGVGLFVGILDLLRLCLVGLGEGAQLSFVGEKVGLLNTADVGDLVGLGVGLFVGNLDLLRLVGLGVGLLVGWFVGNLDLLRLVGLGVGLLVGWFVGNLYTRQ